MNLEECNSVWNQASNFKINEHVALVWFEITSMISDQNCMKWSSITILLNPFLHKNNYIACIQHLLVCTNIWLIQYWATLYMVPKVLFHFPAFQLVTKSKPWNFIDCFVLVKLSNLLQKRCSCKKWCHLWINCTGESQSNENLQRKMSCWSLVFEILLQTDNRLLQMIEFVYHSCKQHEIYI